MATIPDYIFLETARLMKEAYRHMHHTVMSAVIKGRFEDLP